MDVLESEHNTLVTKIEATEDYQEVQRLRAVYLANINRRSFLTNSLVSKSFSNIFALAHELCGLVECKY